MVFDITMDATWLWVRAMTRHTLDGLVLIALLAGLSGAVVLIAVVGAQRTRSALDRAVAADDPGLIHLSSQDPSAFEGLNQIPGVRLALPLETFIGNEGITGTSFLLFMVPRPFGTSVDRIEPTQGRLPSDADEVLLTDQAATTLHLDVGDTLSFEAQSWDEFDAFNSPEGATGNEPRGPNVSLQVVGIGASLMQKVQPDNAVGWVSEEFAAQYDPAIAHVGGANGARAIMFAWVDGGEASIAAVAKALQEVDPPVGFSTFAAFSGPVRSSTGTMASGALVFAVAAAVAAFGAIAVAVARHLARFRGDRPALEAMGVTRRGWALLGAAMVAPAAVASGLVTVTATLAASRLMPFGATARRVDPDVGSRPSVVTLVVAGIAVASAVTAVALLGSWRRAVGRGRRPAHLVTRMMSGPVGRWPTVTTGVGFAVDGRGANQVGVVRAALLAGVLGVAGVVGGASVVSALDGLHSTPSRWGYNWTVTINWGDKADVADARQLLASPSLASSVAGWAIGSNSSATVNGLEVRADTFDVQSGSIAPALRRGRLPNSPSEVVISSSLAADLHVSIGDDVTATTDTGSESLTIVGEATLYPVDSGLLRIPAVLVTPAGQTKIARDETAYRLALLAAPGVSADELYDRLVAVLGDDMPPRADSLPAVPSEVRNAAQLRGVAVALALFTGALGLALVTNAIFVTRRRRGRDLAVLSALGTTPGQTARVIEVQAVTISLISIVVGVPVGVVAGHAAFARIAEHSGAAPGPVLARGAVAATVAAVVVLTPLVAAWPAWRAARSGPTAMLRDE
jgi:FtsX-like permease family